MLSDARETGNDSCGKMTVPPDCELRKQRAWAHGIHHLISRDSVKARCMWCGQDGRGLELPPRAALEDAHLQDHFLFVLQI